MVRTLLTPRWLLALLVAGVFAVACVSLGRWQWSKYEGKLARNAVIAANYSATPVPLTSVQSRVPLAADGEWTRVTASGRYDASGQLLVRNRVLQGTPGLEVLVPFVVDTGDAAGEPVRVLVDRGWVQNADTAAAQPVVPATPSGLVTVQGWLRRPEVDLDRDLRDRQLASINVTDAQAAIGGAPLLDTYLVLDQERAADGSVPARPTPLEPPDTDLGPNQAYAFQWWLFAAFGFVFYGYRIRVLKAERDLASSTPQEPPRTVVVPPELVGAGAATPRHPKAKKVRIWDEEDG